MNYLNITTDFGGKQMKRQMPCHFGFAALAEFTDLTNIPLSEIAALGENMDLADAFKLIWLGLKHGHRKEGKNFDITWLDIADAADVDQGFIEKAFEYLAKSFDTEKKSQPKPVTAKAKK